MASSSHKGGDFYGAASYRSREGLSTRPVGGSEEIQLRIDPIHGDLDDEIYGLRNQVRQLRNNDYWSLKPYLDQDDFATDWHLLCGMPKAFLLKVAQEIQTEAKFQNDFIDQLQMILTKAQAGVKNNMRRLNRSIIKEGSNNIMHVVLFALLVFFVIYLMTKFSRR